MADKKELRLVLDSREKNSAGFWNVESQKNPSQITNNFRFYRGGKRFCILRRYQQECFAIRNIKYWNLEFIFSSRLSICFHKQQIIDIQTAKKKK